MQIQTWAAAAAGAPLKPQRLELADPGRGEVQIEVSHCGLCHSDVSMLDNAWQWTQYPLVPGHEAVGRVVRLGAGVAHLAVGQTVGVGWTSGSCGSCGPCIDGDANLCGAAQPTIVGRPGGFASHLNAQALWALPIPAALRPEAAGPLLCGGATVFNPFVQFGVRPTDRVAVVGVGGLGHLALQFGRAWGCEVTAFTSAPDKHDGLRRLGAHRVLPSRAPEAWKPLAGHFDFILVTANAPLDWAALLATLRPRGRLDFVGIPLEPVAFGVFDLLGAQRQISASPSGSPATLRRMLEFCARHGIEPTCEPFPMREVNAAIDHLRAGRARYRVVLRSDF